MKILLIAPFFYPVRGGMEENILQTAKQLVKKGHKVTVFTSSLSRDRKIKTKEEIYEGIKIKRFDSWFKIGDFASFFPGIFIANKREFDIIHIHGYRHPTNLMPLFTKKPCFITLHWPNYPKELRSKINGIIIPTFDRLLGKFLLKKYIRIIAINKLEIDWLLNQFNLDNKNIKLIPNGIPKDYIKLKDNKNFKNKYNIKKNSLNVLSLSRIHKSKGLDLTIKVAKYFPKINFLIAGSPTEYLQELKKLKEKLKTNNVKFLGEIEESTKLDAYKSADIFLFPSHYEGFGIVILEAFSQKTCVLSSDAGALPWVVDDAGLLFKDNDLEDLRKKLELLINNKDLRKKYANLGHKKVNQYTWEKIVDKLEEEYKKVLVSK